MKKNILLTVLVAIMSIALFIAGCSNNSTPGGNNGNIDSEPVDPNATHYTVTFDSNGGSSVDSQSVAEGRHATMPAAPTRDGYSLTGWYSASTTTAVDRWYFGADRVTSNLTLYAGWATAESVAPTESLTFTQETSGYVVSGVGDDTSVVIPATHEGLPVIAIGASAFVRKNITSVTIPDSVQEIRLNAFNNCSSLTTVNIGEGSGLTTILNNAFSGNSALTAIYIPSNVATIGTSLPNSTSIGNAVFNNCGSLARITVASNNTTFNSEGGHLIETATHTLYRGSNNPVIPDGVLIIGQAAFRRSTLTSIEIPASVTQIENYVFDDMENLTSITVSQNNANFSSVDGVLYNKAQTELLESPEAVTGNITLPQTLTEIPSFAFDGRSQLTAIYVPTSVTSIRSFAFRNTTLTINYQGTESEWAAVTKHSTWGGGELTVNYSATQETPISVLVVYFSATNQTERVAHPLAEAMGATLVEIEAEVPYTTADLNYNNSSSRVSLENNEATRPAISTATYEAINWEDYTHVFIGHPIWWGIEPPIIRTFIDHYNAAQGAFTGKSVYTFTTAASSDNGRSHGRVTSSCSGATIPENGNLHLTTRGLSNVASSVATWVESLNLAKDSEDSMRIKMAFSGNEIYVDLTENAATEDLVSRLSSAPMTLDFSDYGSAEKIAYPTPALNVEGTTGCDPEVGDLTIYTPWGNLAAFYRDTSGYSASLVLVGKIEENGIELLAAQSGTFSVTLSLA